MTADGYRPADLAGVEVAEGATKEGVILSIKRGGALSGRVLDPMRHRSRQRERLRPGRRLERPRQGRLRDWAASASQRDHDRRGRALFVGRDLERKDPADGVSSRLSGCDAASRHRAAELRRSDSRFRRLDFGQASSVRTAVRRCRERRSRLNEEGDTRVGFGSDSTRADGSGGFLFEHLQAGRFMIAARRTRKDDQPGSRSRGRAEPHGSAPSDGDRSAPAGHRHRAAGRAAGRGSSRGQRPEYNDNTTTDDSGKYSLSNVPAGVIRLTASTAGLSGRSTADECRDPGGRRAVHGRHSVSGRIASCGPRHAGR